ncbi:MAG TPA: hypothetical protein VEU72_08675 [Nitrosopumilaceae archaeon]|nr:hypothetical protein [Nitrosopumilaceae archaeon]
MSKLEELKNHSEFKKFLLDNFLAMINELVEQETQVVNNYYNNRTMPFDLYNLTLREIQTKIQCKKEVYLRLTDEELE